MRSHIHSKIKSLLISMAADAATENNGMQELLEARWPTVYYWDVEVFPIISLGTNFRLDFTAAYSINPSHGIIKFKNIAPLESQPDDKGCKGHPLSRLLRELKMP